LSANRVSVKPFRAFDINSFIFPNIIKFMGPSHSLMTSWNSSQYCYFAMGSPWIFGCRDWRFWVWTFLRLVGKPRSTYNFLFQWVIIVFFFKWDYHSKGASKRVYIQQPSKVSDPPLFTVNIGTSQSFQTNKVTLVHTKQSMANQSK